MLKEILITSSLMNIPQVSFNYNEIKHDFFIKEPLVIKVLSFNPLPSVLQVNKIPGE